MPELGALSAPGAHHDPRYADFLPAAREIVATPPSRAWAVSGYVLCGIVTAALVWAMFWRLSLFAIAPGEIQARGGTLVVEPGQAGQVAAIRAKDGDHVKKGDLLVELDATAALANQTVIRNKLVDLAAEIVRRRAEMLGARADPVDKAVVVTWPGDIPPAVRTREEGILRAELSQLAATLADLDAQRLSKQAAKEKFTGSIAAQKSLIAAHSERTGMHEQLASQGWDSRAQVLQALEPLRQEQVRLADLEGSLAEAEAAIPVVDSEIARTRESFATANTQQIASAERQTADLAQQLAKADNDLADMSLRAPADGVVHASALTTVGQSVKAGQQLLQVVPDAAPLEIQAYVLNTDIGFVRQGQTATIKVDTFPYTRYGTIPGVVTVVASDAVTGGLALHQQKNGSAPDARGDLSVTNPAVQASDLVFPVTIVPAKTSIDVDGRAVPLSAGMSVAVEIETERVRAITYILYPLARAFPAKGG